MRDRAALGATQLACLLAMLIAPAAHAGSVPTLAQLPGTAGCISGPPATESADPRGCARASHGFPLFGTSLLSASPDGRDIYVTGFQGDGSSVASLRRDPVSGALTEGPCLSTNLSAGCAQEGLLTGAKASAVSPDGRNVYTATDGGAPGTAGGIVAFAREAATGRLTKIGCTGNIDGCDDRDLALAGASAVAVPPDGRHVYVAAAGRLITMARAPDGRLRRVACIGSTDGCDPDPELTACRSKPPLACRTEGGYAADHLAFSADSRRLYMATLDALPRVFTRNPDTGEMTAGPVPSCDVLGVNACVGIENSLALAVSRDGRDVYSLLNRWAQPGVGGPEAVLLRSRPSATAPVLVPWGCFSGNFSPACANRGVMAFVGGIAMAPDDQAVYTAFSDGSGRPGVPHAGVGVLSRNPTNGALTPAGCVSSDGTGGQCVQGPGLNGAQSLLVSPDGRNVYAAGNGQVAVLGPAVDSPARGVRFSRAGRTRLTLTCPAVAGIRCRGTLVVAAARSRRTLASRRFSVAPGRSGRVVVVLTRRAGLTLWRGRRIKGQLRLRASGRVSGRSIRQVTLRRLG